VNEQRLSVAGDDDIVASRQRAREVARELGFGLVDQSRIATAVSELARNAVRFATRGEVVIRSLPPAARGVGIEIVVRDQGPGIEDIELAMRPGYTSGDGLGLGLSGTRRLVDEMELDSAPGRGTLVTIRKWRR
jgi:serine/threonine-protein kinase RsbT